VNLVLVGIIVILLVLLIRKGRSWPLVRAVLPLKEFRSTATSYADLLPYAMRISDDVVLNIDGSFTASYLYRGQDLESAPQIQLNALSTRVNQTFRRFGAGWMFQVDLVRHPAQGYPINSRFPDRVSWIIDEERRADFNRAEAHYTSDYVLHVTYFPPADRSRSAWNFFIQDEAGITSSPASESLKTFNEGLAYIESMLKDDLALRRLRVRSEINKFGQTDVDEQLGTFILAATNRDILPRAIQEPQAWLAPFATCENLRNGFALRIGDHILTVIAMDDVPAATQPGILDILDHMAISYRAHWRFIVLDKTYAEQQIQKTRTKWFAKRRGVMKSLQNDESGFQNTDALNMADDANQALADVSDNKVSFGYFSMSIVVWERVGVDEAEADAKARLRANVDRLVAELTKLHFIPRIEEENALEAFLGTLPAIAHAQVRRPMLSSRNFADVIPTTAVWTGSMTCPNPLYPPDSPPLAYVSTSGTTPFAFNIHVQDVGHTLIVGATGGGKSTLLGTILAQHRRYPNARQIIIDVDRSHYALCKAVEGKHYDIGVDTMRFCPLAHIDDPYERQWAEGWIASLLQMQDIDPRQHRGAIYTALEDLANSNVPRSLSNFTTQGLPNEVKEALRYYTVSGSAMPVLDGEKDDIEIADMTCFEMQALMQLDKCLVNAVLQYLFHYVERVCTGQPTILAAEEVWLFLENAQAREAMNRWLRTMRKKNVAAIFTTQSINELAKSEIAAALIGLCLTKIYVANPEAEEPIQAESYRSVGLTNWHIRMLAQARSKRDYFVTQPRGRRMIQMNIGPVSRCFVGVSSKDDVNRIRELIQAEEAYMAERQQMPEANWQVLWIAERLQREMTAQEARQWISYFLRGPDYARETAPALPPPLERIPA